MNIYSFGFSFFAKIFEICEYEILAFVKDDKLCDAWFFKSSSPNFKMGLELIKSELSGELKGQKFDEISADFTRLFLNDTYFVKAPPYASFYYDDRGEVYSLNSKKVARVYESFNYIWDAKFPADSVVNELRFVANLYKNDEIKGANEFLESEILPYIFRFLNLIFKSAKSKFYQGISLVFKEFLEIIIKDENLTPQKRILYN